MKKSIKNLMMAAAIVALPFMFTSCEDIFGEWSRPAPNPVVPTPEPTMLETPLTLEAKEAGAVVTFKIFKDKVDVPKVIEYSTDGGTTWTEGNTLPPGVSVTLTHVGDKVMFRGTNAAYANDTHHNNISCSADCYVYGNIMSLINKENFATNKELTGDLTFSRLFFRNTKLLNHPTKTLELPATTLTNNCYESMFEECTALTTAPALPATTLKYGCYRQMFKECTALTTAPALPATQLADYCYWTMFYKCTALQKAPKLPAMTLVEYCYTNMFSGCTKLNEAWVKAAYNNDNNECGSMFDDCATGGTLHTDGTGWTAGSTLPSVWTTTAYE